MLDRVTNLIIVLIGSFMLTWMIFYEDLMGAPSFDNWPPIFMIFFAATAIESTIVGIADRKKLNKES